MNRAGERWLVMGAHEPFPAKNGSALRIRQHIEMLRGEGATVQYFQVAPKIPWAELSTGRKIVEGSRIFVGAVRDGEDPNCTFIFNGKIADAVEASIRDFKPNHVLICESWMAAYVAHLLKVTMYKKPFGFWWHQYLDLHNVEASLRYQISRSKKGIGRFTEARRSDLMFETEFWLSNISDEVWVCSRVDQERVLRLYGRESKVVPNKIFAEHYENVPRCTLRSFGMVGIWSYGPNAEAADIILKEVAPKVTASTVVLVGRNPTEAMKKATSGSVRVLGEVDDVRAALGQMRTVVVPLLQGGGTRMKVLEAMAAGIPVIATEKAVEGLDVKHLEHCVICKPEEMADWILKLWDSPGLENVLRDNARKLVKERYSW